ncbi:hypothetical protein LXL04_020281 [Taraxacum kok-saghyz]
MKLHHLTLRTIINAIIEDFGHEDAELHKSFPEAPPLRAPNMSLDGIGDISLGFSLEPVRALSFEDDHPEEGKTSTLLCFRLEEKHLYSSGFLQRFVESLEEDHVMEAAAKNSFLSELRWFLAVRKHWIDLLPNLVVPEPVPEPVSFSTSKDLILAQKRNSEADKKAVYERITLHEEVRTRLITFITSCWSIQRSSDISNPYFDIDSVMENLDKGEERLDVCHAAHTNKKGEFEYPHDEKIIGRIRGIVIKPPTMPTSGHHYYGHPRASQETQGNVQ